jgi:hypothetical protein
LAFARFLQACNSSARSSIQSTASSAPLKRRPEERLPRQPGCGASWRDNLRSPADGAARPRAHPPLTRAFAFDVRLCPTPCTRPPAARPPFTDAFDVAVGALRPAARSLSRAALRPLNRGTNASNWGTRPTCIFVGQPAGAGFPLPFVSYLPTI